MTPILNGSCGGNKHGYGSQAGGYSNGNGCGDGMNGLTDGDGHGCGIEP